MIKVYNFSKKVVRVDSIEMVNSDCMTEKDC